MKFFARANRHSITYRLPGAAWTLEFDSLVVDFLGGHVQKGRLAKEAAGQLYARELSGDAIHVEVATVLAEARSTRTNVLVDIPSAEAERVARFAQGFHCVGFWHSHPEPVPHPSGEDLMFAADHARAARSHLTGLVFVIVGTARFPEGLCVGLHDGVRWTLAAPI